MSPTLPSIDYKQQSCCLHSHHLQECAVSVSLIQSLLDPPLLQPPSLLGFDLLCLRLFIGSSSSAKLIQVGEIGEFNANAYMSFSAEPSLFFTQCTPWLNSKMFCLHTRSGERPFPDNPGRAPHRQDPQRPPRQLRYVITCHTDTLERRVFRQPVRQGGGSGRASRARQVGW